MSHLRPNSMPNRQLISESNTNMNNASTTTTPTQSHIVPQLPSPPDTLDLSSESPTTPASDNQPSSSRPSTPQRGRTASRYPTSLGPGRVPLHRRGTSKTYERLEDLLREAGYKETRVFTPETERAEAEAEKRRERELRVGQGGNVRGGVGVVVGFLAGLMSRAPSLARDTDAETRVGQSSASRTITPAQQEYSPPPSPLAHKAQLYTKRSPVSSHSHSPSPTTPTFTSSAESLTRSRRGSSSNIIPTYRITTPNESNSDSTPRASHAPPHPHTSLLRPQPSFSSNQVPQTYAQASKARAYLRHMASAPSIQPSPENTRPTSVRHSSSRYAAGSRYGYVTRKMVVLNDSDADGEDEYMGHRGNGEGEDESEIHGRPPLPRTWVENVARAILFGGPGAHAGIPSSSSSVSHSHPQSPRPKPDNMQMSPSMSTNSALLEQTSAPQVILKGRRAPPFLCTQVAAYRTPSETRVSRTRVVCRSAPGSRSGSRVRGGDMDLGLDVKIRDRGKEKGVMKGRHKPKTRRVKGKGREKDGVPSLARTQAQDDGWANLRGGEMYTSSSEEDEEGELDLARLLVPPKRQNSIQSLRRHLHGPLPPSFIHDITSSSSSARSGTRSATGSVRSRRRGELGWEGWDQEQQYDEDGDEDWRRGMMGGLRAKHGKGVIDEGETFEGLFFGTDRTGGGAGSKRRGGIPGAWATGS